MMETSGRSWMCDPGRNSPRVLMRSKPFGNFLRVEGQRLTANIGVEMASHVVETELMMKWRVTGSHATRRSVSDHDQQQKVSQ